MGTTSDKLSYLNTTKGLIKDNLNLGGANLTNETFRQYANAVKNNLKSYLANGLDTVWNNWDKTTGSGTSLTLNDTIQAPMKIELGGNTSQKTSILPNGYTQVDYIQNSSYQNTHINTGILWKNTTRIETKFETVSVGSNGSKLFVASKYTSSTPQAPYIYITSSDELSSSGIYSLTGTINGEYVDVSYNGGLNENEISITTWSDNTWGGVFKYKYFKIYYGTELVKHFIPCFRNSDNAIGMYDLVTNTFYENDGASAYIKGSNTTLPNPDYPQTVHTVTGNNNVNICGKNLLNPDYIETSSTNAYFYQNTGYLLRANTTYTISYKGENNLAGIYLKLYQSDTNLAVKYNGKTLSYTPTEDVEVWFNFYSTDIDNSISNFQLEVGSTATPYTPYISQTYSLTLGDIEYCEIEDYKDEFIKATNETGLESGKWYLKKNIGKVVLDGSENFSIDTSTNVRTAIKSEDITGIESYTFGADIPRLISNYFLTVALDSTWLPGKISRRLNDNKLYFILEPNTTVQDFQNWLSTHNTVVCYVLATPTYTLLNDTLQQQLNDIEMALSYDEQTNISQTNADLPFELNVRALIDM